MAGNDRPYPPYLPRPPDAPYSALNAITGSIRDARHAGIAVASKRDRRQQHGHARQRHRIRGRRAVQHASHRRSRRRRRPPGRRSVRPPPDPSDCRATRPITSPGAGAERHARAEFRRALRDRDTTPRRTVRLVASNNATTANAAEHADDHVVARLRRAQSLRERLQVLDRHRRRDRRRDGAHTARERGRDPALR